MTFEELLSKRHNEQLIYLPEVDGEVREMLRFCREPIEQAREWVAACSFGAACGDFRLAE